MAKMVSSPWMNPFPLPSTKLGSRMSLSHRNEKRKMLPGLLFGILPLLDQGKWAADRLSAVQLIYLGESG